MASQNYANHRQYVPLYHMVLFPILALTAIGSVVNLVKSLDDHERLYNASLIVVLSFAAVVMWAFTRIFSLKAQDRAIRAEENLRHFAITGKLLDARLTIQQVVALRFAPDLEFVALAKKAAEAGTSPDDIKKSIKDWRADTYRV